MKPIDKLMVMAIALLAMVAVSACSSDDDPMTPYKGKIDYELLSAISRGDRSILLEIDSVYTVRKKVTDKEWKETVVVGWSASSLVITDGKALRSVSLINTTDGASILYIPWNVYCHETGYDKTYAFASSLEYDEKNKTISFGASKNDIEKAVGDELNISETLEWDIEGEPGLTKFTYCYKIKPYFKGIEDYIIVKTEKEAKLAMVKLLREHYGDVMRLKASDFQKFNEHSVLKTNPVIDLAALEDDIVNNRGEWNSWGKVTFPDKYPD